MILEIGLVFGIQKGLFITNPVYVMASADTFMVQKQ
jgi:hypothetical protein